MKVIKKIIEKIGIVFESIKTILADNTKTFARSPRKFALKDWKNALQEAGMAIKTKRLPILAAGVAYFLTLAVFPGIAAFVAILSFVISESQLTDAVHSIETYLPTDIARLITSQLESALENPSSSFFIVVAGIAIALFGLSGAVTNSIKAVNATYDRVETRKFITLRAISLAFLATGVVIAVLVGGLLALSESYLVSIGIPEFLATLIIIVRWVVVAALAALGLAVFYRYAPDRDSPHWQWVTWGSCIATAVWLIGTTLFFVYVRYLANYTDTYSVFAGIVVLMIWLNLSAFAILLGAEINHRLENQTRAKTTK